MSLKDWDKIKHKKQFGSGGIFKHNNIFPFLKSFFDEMRNGHRVVTVNILCAEYKKLSGEANVPNTVIRHRVYRWMAKESITKRQITHQAQNTHHCKSAIQDFVHYINSQMQNLNIK